MRILYVAMKHDYGDPSRGLSFEHHNFYDALVNMGHDVVYFDFMDILARRGREGMNARLREVVDVESPELMFVFPFQNELDPRVVRRVSDDTNTVTFAWFADDHWRFDDFSSRWAPCFNWISTTDASAPARYAEIGVDNVVKTQWACNHFLYRPREVPVDLDVSFVGQPHRERRGIVEALRRAGVRVDAWGHGWETGRLGQEEMIEVFCRSRINLNLTNASVAATPPRRKRGLRGWWARRVASRGGAGGRAPARDQIKGRNFEVPGCGGFLLTGRADDLERYYVDGEEIVAFDGTADMIDQARHYLAHEDERTAVAEAGLRRTLREHTYVHRFAEIFAIIGLRWEPTEDALAGRARPGATLEIE